MTCIVSEQFKTKKAFYEAIKTKGADKVFIEDPSIVAPFYGSVADYMKTHNMMTMTNHPKRSWFGSITVKSDGTLKLS